MAIFSLTGCQLIMDDLEAVDASREPGLDAASKDTDASIGEDAADTADASGLDATDTPEGDAQQTGDSMTPAPDADAMPDPVDAVTPDADPAACDGAGSRVFFRDSDEDGYGDPGMTRTACEVPAGYVENDEDCNDRNGDAHPGQTAFFTTGYNVPGTSIRSFDYDCDTNERGQPGVPQYETCSSGLLGCTGNGYKLDPNRANMGNVNPYCGSDVFVQCGASGLLACGPTPAVSGEPFGCN